MLFGLSFVVNNFSKIPLTLSSLSFPFPLLTSFDDKINHFPSPLTLSVKERDKTSPSIIVVAFVNRQLTPTFIVFLWLLLLLEKFNLN